MSSNENPVLTFTDMGLTFTVSFDRYDTVSPARSQYYWSIASKHRTEGEGEAVLAEGTDLRSPGDPDLAGAMRSLLHFYSAALESWDYQQRTGKRGENADLFPEAVLDLGIGSDDVAYAASWLGRDDD
jgi:hypothetical protein